MRLLKFTFLFAALLCFSTEALAVNSGKKKTTKTDLSEIVADLSFQEFLDLSPKKYRKMTGKKLGFRNTVKLKTAQIAAKASVASAVLPKGVYIILAIFGLGWLAMGLNDDFDGDNWWIGLLLYFLFWLPGFIFTLVKMSEYY